MTPNEAQEKAREIWLEYQERRKDYRLTAVDLADYFEKAVTQALIEAHSEGFARGQEKKASCICDVRWGPCELHRPIIEKAREEVMKEFTCPSCHSNIAYCEDCRKKIREEQREVDAIITENFKSKRGIIYGRLQIAAAIRAQGDEA